MISRLLRFPVVLGVALLAGCGGDDGTGPGSHDGTGPASDEGTPPRVGWEALEGTYTGTIAGLSQGFALAADIRIVFEQFGGRLLGESTLSGTLTAGTAVLGVRGAGNFTGTIDRGLDPSVNITFVNQCPGYSSHFSGALESTTSLLTISGPAHILVDCVIVLTFQTTILMSRIPQPEDIAG